MVMKRENAVVLSMSSPTSDEWLGYKINPTKGLVVCDFHKGFIHAKALPDGKCLLKFIFNADPHLDYIP
jgi:hypothetical protein